MDFEKFLNDDITTLSEEIVTFFGQPLTPEVLEEYPVHMLVTEFLGHHEDVGDFEAIEKLQQTLIDHNSDFFQQVKGFFVNYLVKYYCFKQDAEKVEHYLKLYVDGYEDYDLLLLTMHEALFYGYTNVVDELIESLYERVKNDQSLVEGASIDFILFKFSIELEKVYHQYQQTSADPDWGALQEKMAQYDFDLKQDFLEVIKGGMLHSGENVSQEFLSGFPIHKQPILGALQIIFMKYIHSKGCSFVLSAMIWNDLGAYWTNRKSSNWTQFFDIEKDSFIEFARSKGGMMMDYRNHIALLVWGSAYVIEFLHAIQLYNEETYQQQMAKVASIKQEFKEAYNIDLWQYSFVWQWEPLAGFKTTL